MKKLIAVMALLLPFGLTCMAKSKTVTIKIVQTSDVHGSFFPYDYINRWLGRWRVSAVMSSSCASNMAIM